MKLVNKYPNSKYSEMEEYFCDITSELDKLAGINADGCWKHYILADRYCINEKCLVIRIPGGTLGEICFDDNNIITKVKVDTDYVVKSYPIDVNEQIQKFVGQKIEF
jgi:hypothetical protein